MPRPEPLPPPILAQLSLPAQSLVCLEPSPKRPRLGEPTSMARGDVGNRHDCAEMAARASSRCTVGIRHEMEAATCEPEHPHAATPKGGTGVPAQTLAIVVARGAAVAQSNWTEPGLLA